MNERHNRGAFKLVKTSTTLAVLVEANPQRTSLIVGTAPSANIWITDQPQAAAQTGIMIVSNFQGLEFNLHNAGDWIKKTLYHSSANSSNTFGVLEVICPCQEPPLPI